MASIQQLVAIQKNHIAKLEALFQQGGASFTSSELIAFGSLCIACFSVCIAFRSLRNSSKALSLAEAEYGEKRKSIDAYLLQAKKVVLSEDAEYAAFAISYTNKASIPNVLARIELDVFYTDGAGRLHETYLQNERSFPENIEDIRCVSLPLNIPARSSSMGWLVFKFTDYLKAQCIKKYEVVGYSSDGQRISVACHLLMEAYFYDEKI